MIYFKLILLVIAIIAVYDILQDKHTIWHNYPVIGHLRFLFEKIGPEIRQYFVENNREGLPFNRSQRTYVYASAKKENNNEGFGSDKNFNENKHFFIKSALFPLNINMSEIKNTKIIGMQRAKPYKPNRIINISGMSFGALSGAAVEAMNKGAKLAGCYHTTGEGGLSPYHCNGADVVFQFGTGYNGVRNEDGTFSMNKLVELTKKHAFIKMIEIKLHQGAKPGAWSILPLEKMTDEIASIRGIKNGEPSISPGFHTLFSNSNELLHTIESIALNTGLPVGIKCGVGNLDSWKELAKLISVTNTKPDYIVIDGGEGGTGSAKGSFVDHVGLPFLEAFSSVYKIFKQYNIHNDVCWIGSGKLGFPSQVILAMTMGCDFINVAREAMMSIGCIQAQKCHLNTCPTGIATQNKWKQLGLDSDLKSVRFANYIDMLQKNVMEITAAAGYSHPCQFKMNDIVMNTGGKINMTTLFEIYEYSTDKK